jgi:diaminopimelate decarboxylase/aspartate kinase
VLDEPEISPARQWLSARCKPGADQDLQKRWQTLSPVVITQGFVARAGARQTALLGRGGSDTSAALLAGRLGAFEVEIWTDVPGLFSADPRLVPEARLLTQLHYDEALEMAASGARVVHPDCIRTAAATATPVVIRDSARPQLNGTRISDGIDNRKGKSLPGVKAVTCQKGIEVFLLQNIDSRREVGFLARVFDIFRRHGLSIDLVATSETTTTVSINGPANHLNERMRNELVSELQTQCMVKAFSDCVCINLVGSGVRTAFARLQSSMAFFDDHPLLMLSQSANDLCLSLLVEFRDHEKLLKSAHTMLIPAETESSAGVFGDCWLQMLQS